ncbi:protein of unknown function [Burkholderia multivorans]
MTASGDGRPLAAPGGKTTRTPGGTRPGAVAGRAARVDGGFATH